MYNFVVVHSYFLMTLRPLNSNDEGIGKGAVKRKRPHLQLTEEKRKKVVELAWNTKICDMTFLYLSVCPRRTNSQVFGNYFCNDANC